MANSDMVLAKVEVFIQHGTGPEQAHHKRQEYMQ